MKNPENRIVIVADGSFPVNQVPLEYMKHASKLICCDGSTQSLLNAGFVPDAIVGDMDSLEDDLALRFADRLFRSEDQETNDLTKTVKWCIQKGYNDLIIIGATGKREDHTIGNISLLAEYAGEVNVLMVTDTGFFFPLTRSAIIESFPGQQVSIFSIDCDTEITSAGLKFPLLRSRISNWWQATLNEATGSVFNLEFEKGRVIVYLNF